MNNSALVFSNSLSGPNCLTLGMRLNRHPAGVLCPDSPAVPVSNNMLISLHDHHLLCHYWRHEGMLRICSQARNFEEIVKKHLVILALGAFFSKK
jgi:hypothetical protein